MQPTWKELAPMYPEFVAWVVQRYGPLPEGPIEQELYDRATDAYRLIKGDNWWLDERMAIEEEEAVGG